MDIRWGRTRFVFRFKNHVYKIGRVRPVGMCAKAVLIYLSKKHHESLHKKYHPVTSKALWRYLFAGLYSNLAELAYWSITQDVRCVPISGSYFGGWILVQKRAQDVSLAHVRSSEISYLLSDRELGAARQYGTYQGRCRVLDYAHWGVQMNQ